MDTLKLLIAVHDYGLRCELFSKKDVIQFCDTLIENIPNLPYEIIEASLMSHSKVEDIEYKLSQCYEQDIDLNYTNNIILSIISYRYSNNDFEIGFAIKCIYKLLIQTGLYSEDEYYNLYFLDDMYELAVTGVYGEIGDIINHFRKEISEFDKYYDDFSSAINILKQLS